MMMMSNMIQMSDNFTNFNLELGQNFENRPMKVGV